MKQKAVIKVYLKDQRCQKCRTKALKLVVSTQGIESAGWTGPERDEIELVGNNVELIKLTKLIRKKVGSAELVTVSLVKPDSGSPPPVPAGSGFRDAPPHMYVALPLDDGYPPTCSNCSIM